MADMLVNTKDWKMKMKEGMENDNVVMCHEEGMSRKTTIPWQEKQQKQKENTEELVLPPLHNIHANEYNHAKDSAWKDKRWKWD